MTKHKYPILLMIFLAGFVISTILSFIPLPTICAPTQGCESVLLSNYSKFLGIKNSTYGMILFLILIFTTLLHIKSPKNSTRHIIHFGTIVGTGISLIFLYLQAFVLHSYCKYCLVIDISIIIGLLIVLIFWKK